jgi:hypothetical protein
MRPWPDRRMILAIVVCVALVRPFRTVADEPKRQAAEPGSVRIAGLVQGRWHTDPAEAVARNDVLYTTPSVNPWEAMPTGGGDLSAMVRWDGTLQLHLSKSNCWGFQAMPDALPVGAARYDSSRGPASGPRPAARIGAYDSLRHEGRGILHP